MPVKPLSFKGDKSKPKKRKHHDISSADPESQTQTQPSHAPSADSEADEAWTHPDTATDLTGPTILILPTTPATCLAADAHGNVFASPLENMIEDDPSTAEPHDVRQVWIANQVAGTQEVSFKATHGGYLSCDTVGVLGAKREARGAEEGFLLEMVAEEDEGKQITEGRRPWRVKTAASQKAGGEKGSRYLCAVAESKGADEDGLQKKKLAVSLRGDGEANSMNTHLLVRMQARFKPRLQQNKETKAREKVSRKELEVAVGRTLTDEEVKRLKRAKKDGTYYEQVLDVRVKGKHDKFAS